MPLYRVTLRVLVALVTSLSMLHFTLEGSGVACSSSGVESAQSGMAVPGAGSHVGHHAPAASDGSGKPDGARQQGDDRAPAQERCCESMSSCGATIVASMSEGDSVPRAAGRITAHSASMLASVTAAPEPPPPKA